MDPAEVKEVMDKAAALRAEILPIIRRHTGDIAEQAAQQDPRGIRIAGCALVPLMSMFVAEAWGHRRDLALASLDVIHADMRHHVEAWVKKFRERVSEREDTALCARCGDPFLFEKAQADKLRAEHPEQEFQFVCTRCFAAEIPTQGNA